MNPDLIIAKIESVENDFNAHFGIPLWKNPPLTHISDLRSPVNNMDGLKSRIASLLAIFDQLNKEAFDAKLGHRTDGTREAWLSFLKRECPDDQPFIQERIEVPLGRIAQLRAFLLHGRTKGYKKALEFFALPEPIADPTDAWAKVLYKSAEVADSIAALMARRRRPAASISDLTEEPLRLLVAITYRRHQRQLEDDKVGPLVREILHAGEILDTDLAARFNVGIDELRERLFPLIDSVIHVRPHNMDSTRISIVPPMRECLRDPARWLTEEFE